MLLNLNYSLLELIQGGSLSKETLPADVASKGTLDLSRGPDINVELVHDGLLSKPHRLEFYGAKPLMAALVIDNSITGG